MDAETEALKPRHEIRRVRRDTRRRRLTVSAVERLTPRMVRVHFSSPELHDFVSDAPDDHVKLFFDPGASAQTPSTRGCMRDFTPRRFDPRLGVLQIDLALHEAGPAAEWASRVRPGDQLDIGGPRGSAIVPDDFDWYLLIGDETALPAIGRWVEQLRPGVPVSTVVVVEDQGEIQNFETQAAWRPIWVDRRSGQDDVSRLLAGLSDLALPPGDGFVWIAAEASVARSLRAYVVEDRLHPRAWTKASGYWKRGQAEVHEKIED